MAEEKGFFESTEETVLNIFDSFLNNQTPLEKIIREFENRKVRFEKQGDNFWGVAERIGSAGTKYHIISSKDDLKIFRGTINDEPNKVAHYQGKEAFDFYKDLVMTVPAVMAAPYVVPWGKMRYNS